MGHRVRRSICKPAETGSRYRRGLATKAHKEINPPEEQMRR
nr:MAG TPA: hypothetical protein [Caudoviricetes sp.]